MFNNDDNSALRFPSEPSVKIAAGDDVNRRLNANGLSEVNQQNKPAFIKFVLGAMRLLKNEFRLHSIDRSYTRKRLLYLTGFKKYIIIFQKTLGKRQRRN